MTYIRKLLLLMTSDLFYGLGIAAFGFITTWAAAAFGTEAVVISSLLRIIPDIVFSLLGGVLADKFDPRWLVFLGRLFSTLSLIYLASTPLDSPVPIYIVVLVSGVIGSISAPALSTLVPSLFEKDQYVQVNARLNLVTDATFLVAPLVTGYLQSLQGLRPVALIAALFILSSALVLLWLPQLPRQTTARLDLAYALEGLTHTKGNPALLSVLLFLGLTNAYNAAFYTVLPFFARSIGDAATYGLLLSAMNAGILLGNFLLSTVFSIRRAARTAVMINVGEGLAMMALSLTRTPARAWAPALVSEGLNNLGSTIYISWIQAVVPENLLGRVFSVVQIGGYVFTPLGYAVTPILMAALGSPGSVLVLGAVTATTAAGWLLILPKALSSRGHSENRR